MNRIFLTFIAVMFIVAMSCGHDPSNDGVSIAASVGVSLVWDAPTLNTDGTAITNLAGYVVYRSSTSGGPYTKIGVTVANIISYIDVFNVPDNTTLTYFYVVTAYNTNGNESGYSNEVIKSVTGNNTIAPLAPTNLRLK